MITKKLEPKNLNRNFIFSKTIYEIEINLKENDSNILYKYSENFKKFLEVLKDIKIYINFSEYRCWFDDDKEKRIVITVKIERQQSEFYPLKKIKFQYGMSIHDTQIILGNCAKNKIMNEEKNRIVKNLAYNILTCVKNDYFINSDFDNFCSDFGYDSDSRKAFSTFEKCLKQSNKLKQLFTEEEIESFPS